MAGYSIDDILAELDAKNNGTPAPKKQEEPEKPQASSEEKPSAPEKSKTNTISVSAILGKVVASENSPSPTDAVVSKEEREADRRDSTTEIDAITGTITDIDKVLFETDTFDRPVDKTEMVKKIVNK